jgi:hypothetical protein
MPHPGGGHIVDGACEDCGKACDWASVWHRDEARKAADRQVKEALSLLEQAESIYRSNGFVLAEHNIGTAIFHAKYRDTANA